MGTPPLNNNGFLNLSDIKEVDSETFFNTLNEAKQKLDYEAFVTLHNVEDYNQCKGVFLLYDQSAGVAVEQDGNIISVFSVGLHKDASRFLLAKAVEIGGSKLDCFASDKLRLLYLTRGFVPVSKTKFDEKFAPPTWNYERDNHPDIYFWVYDQDHPSPLEDKVCQEDKDLISEFPSYEEAKEYRDDLLDQVVSLYIRDKQSQDE